MKVKVKPLEWPVLCKRGRRVNCAPSSLVSYCIAHYGGDGDGTIYRWGKAHSPWSEPFGTYEEAKASAQADYEKRILSALVVEETT